ncbi:hypothetical protein [Cohnella thermotolerans]|jgi:hypothetical protein|uniref:hypothetical protein n=1 Tax=Cohnella thermotolerans TaxID=329858 RepID=UPI0004289842|nr:hypothetical protein [Cohnella thermotolerans]
MLDAEGLKAESRKFFIGDMKMELAGLRERFQLTDQQVGQIETMLQWSYNSGFNSGMSLGRQLNVHELMTPDVPSWR